MGVAATLEFKVLGPLELRTGGTLVDLGGPRARTQEQSQSTACSSWVLSGIGMVANDVVGS